MRLEARGWGSKCQVTSLYIALPRMSQKLDEVMLEVPVRPLHMSEIDPRHPRKVPTHVENTRFLGRRGGSAFCLQSLVNVKSSHIKSVTNTKFFWKEVFGVQSKLKHSFTICFSLCRRTEQKGKIERTSRGGLNDRFY